MTRALITLSIALVLTLGSALTTAAQEDLTLNFGRELNAAACGGGKPVINATQQVVNDQDSKVGGGSWAIDNYNRHIQVWEIGDNLFCAVLQYHGQFVTLAGPGPANTGTLSAGVTGTMHGGSRITFSGILKDEPAAALRGSIGEFDYGCTGAPVCANRVDWRTLYFDGLSGNTFGWWGFIYHAGSNGTWINADPVTAGGNRGNITD